MRLLLMLMMVAALPLNAVVLDDFSYQDSAALQAVWLPQGESEPPASTIGGDMLRAARLPARFSTLKDWRVFWDREIKADLSQSEQVLVKLKSPDPQAIGQVLLYFQSGAGWYRMPAFSLGPDWETKILPRSQAQPEDKPEGWDKINRIRIAFMPGAKRDTHIDLAFIGGRSGWPISHMGHLGGYKDLAEADKGLRLLAKGHPRQKDVASRLDQAKALASRAARLSSEERQALILQGRALVAQAHALLQEPKEPEFRAAWLHYGHGVLDKKGQRASRWKEAVPAMHAAGFNAVIPNMLWSGTAYYPSKVVPVNPMVKQEGDYLQEIIDAARPLGMQVHLWKVMWQFAEGWLAEAGVSEPFRKQGRLQVDAAGKVQPWLCPCDKANRSYELNALLEAADYAIDGIHLDYIRYSGTDVDYSPICRSLFEKQSGKKVKNWPSDCVSGGARYDEYAEFKRGVITSFVREAKAALKKKKPDLQFSAAVFPYPAIARDSVGQDWPQWAKENLFDWISTMTYTEDAQGFAAAVAMQQEVMKGSTTRLYPGIQVTFDEGRVLDLDSFSGQVNALRGLGAEGFVIFEYREHLNETLLPYVSAGLMRRGGE